MLIFNKIKKEEKLKKINNFKKFTFDINSNFVYLDDNTLFDNILIGNATQAFLILNYYFLVSNININ